MKVSVIVPVYGVEAWIERCAHSLLSQTWEDLEVIFVNDGTTDRSMEILSEVVKQYPSRDVQILHQSNAGLPQARLAGLRKATGEYVLHMDSDDWAAPEMIEALAKAAAETGSDMVYCDAVEDRPQGRIRPIHNHTYADCPSYARAMVDFRVNSYLWNKLIRRSLYAEDLFYPTISMHEDMVLLSQILPRGGRCTRVPRAMYHYNRTNVGSLSLRSKAERDVQSAGNYLQLCTFWKGRADSPLRSLQPSLLLRAGWIALHNDPSLADRYPILRESMLILKPSAFHTLKQQYRFLRIKSWLGKRPFHSKRILCCIFNYNENEKAIAWSRRLSPYFDTVILDSGSQPPCDDPTAVHLDNIYYSGLMNEAYARACEGQYPWTVVITSDLEISDKSAKALCYRMEKISFSCNVGLYQPANSLFGNSHSKSKTHFFGGIRKSNFQEGWFHMVRTDLLGKICPVDLSVNRLGWGLDMGLCFYANRDGLLILIDSSINVKHPEGTGYRRDEADRQMAAWQKTVPGFQDPFHMPKAPGSIQYPDTL